MKAPKNEKSTLELTPGIKETLEKVYWGITLRFIAVGVAAFLGVMAAISAGVILSWVLVVALVSPVLLYNFAGYFFLKKKSSALTSDLVVLVCFAQLVADMLIITLLIHVTGGILSPFVLLYLYSVIVMSMVAPERPRFGQMLGFFIILFYMAMLVFEYYWTVPPLAVCEQGLEVYQDKNLMLFFLFVFPSAIIIMVFISNNLGRRLAGFRASLLKQLFELDSSHKELEKTLRELQAIDRLKTEFLSMVSHELRTPITPIKGYAALLLGGKMGKLTPVQVKAVSTLNRQSEHLQGLIDSLLDISRLELGKPIPIEKTPLSMKKIIEDIIEAVKMSADNRGLVIKFESDKALPSILGDEIKLNRVITNLVGNALKFTPRGGEITIRAIAEDTQVRVEVIDNGIGIAREYQAKVFDKFVQVDSSYTRAAGGIGMGLAIAKELIELHQGKIWVESAGLGSGSRFIFMVPSEGGK